MNNILSEFNDRTVIYLKIDATQPLTFSLIKEIEDVCNSIEDSGQNSILLMHLIGQQDQTFSHVWPGTVDILYVSKWEKVLRRLEKVAALIITVLEDSCSSLALELLLVSDYRIAAENLIISISRAPNMIWPSMMLHRLVNQIGLAQSRPIVLYGTSITAKQAAELKIINTISSDITMEVTKFAHLLNSVNITDIAIRRQLLLDTKSASFEDILGTHLAACDRTLRSPLQHAKPITSSSLD